MSFFSKKPNTNKLLDEALRDYKAENFNSCYQKVCEAAELGSPRALFCKALLTYNDNIAPDSTPDIDLLEKLSLDAMQGGYSLAYGFYAFVLHISGQIDKLCEFLSKKHSVRDGVYLLYKSSYWFGIFTEEVQAGEQETISAMRESLHLISNYKTQFESKRNTEIEECELYNPYIKFSLYYTYARINFLLMSAYYFEDDWNNRSDFMSTFNETIKYMPFPHEKFKATTIYLKAVLNNSLGMSDLSEANRAIRILNECYNELDEEEREELQEKYSELYQQYEEFYDLERENIDSREINYSDGYTNENALSFNNVTSSILEGVSNWANSSQSSETKTIYTINDVRYTRGEFGYLYDESGIRSDYRVDDYARLYDKNDRELGYFNNNGNFISH